MIVADTNLVAYLLIEGERTEEAGRAWARDPEWLLPALWRSEFLSVLAVSVRGGAIAASEAHRLWIAATELFRRKEAEPSGSRVLDLSLTLGISAYDAHFVAVAEAFDLLLVSADRRLVEACERAVSLEEFAAVP